MISIVLSLVASVSAASEPEVSYRLTLSPGPVVTVTVRCTGDADGVTDFSVAKEWGGVKQDHLEDLLDVRAEAAGEPASIEKPSAHVWRVTHGASAPLAVTYTLARHDDRPSADHGNDYRVILRPDLLHMIGNLSLLIPDRLRNDEKHGFALEWSGFEAGGWNVVSSLGPGEARRTATLRTEEFTSTLLVAGNIRLHEREINGQTLGVSIAGDAWKFDDAKFADQVAVVVKAERDFFDDHSEPWYLVSLIPIPLAASPGSMSLGGTGLTDSFALFATPNMSFDVAEHGGGMSVLHLLAHEYFHNWNGHVVGLKQPEQLGYWFSEGFTDYFARRIMFQAGLMDAAAYVKDVNTKLTRLDESAHRSAPNAKILEGFWSDPDAQALPYIRGDLAAIAIDDAIRRKSGGSRSLDDVMREMVREARAGGPAWETESLLARFEKETDAGFTARLREFIVDGADFRRPTELTHPAAKLVQRTVRVSDPGFDANGAQASKDGAIAGVVEGSAAHAAGLRNGQVLREFAMHPGSANQPPRAKVVVEDRGERQEFEYDALGPPKTVSMYELSEKK